VALHLTEGQVSDYKGASFLLNSMQNAKELLADRGYDATWFREKLLEKGITPCIPSTRSRKKPLPYDKELYKQRHKIEVMFGRLKDWRRIAMRYDRCAEVFLSAIQLAAIVIFYLN
jgi:transposase